MVLYQHDCNFVIEIDGDDLMLSRHNESELEFARLGCAHLAGSKSPSILIGGLGMGYTLRQALDMLSPDAEVVVGELLDAVIEWNRNFLGDLNGKPLLDDRVELKTGNIVELISHSKNQFDAILLDIDNGPNAMTYSGNSCLYGFEGILSCQRALRQKGCLAVWSAGPCKEYEQMLMRCDFHVRRYRVPAYKGSKSQSRFVWVASKSKSIMPPGGGEPRKPIRRGSRKKK